MSRLVMTNKGREFYLQQKKIKMTRDLLNDEENFSDFMELVESIYFAQKGKQSYTIPVSRRIVDKIRHLGDLNNLDYNFRDYEVIKPVWKKSRANINDIIFAEREGEMQVFRLTDTWYSVAGDVAIPFRFYRVNHIDLLDYPDLDCNPLWKKVGDKFKVSYPRKSSEEVWFTIRKILSTKEIRNLMFLPDIEKQNPDTVSEGDIVFFQKPFMVSSIANRRYSVQKRYSDQELWHHQVTRNYKSSDDKLFEAMLGQISFSRSFSEYSDFKLDFYEDIVGCKIGESVPFIDYCEPGLYKPYAPEESKIVGIMTPKTYKKRFLP